MSLLKGDEPAFPLVEHGTQRETVAIGLTVRQQLAKDFMATLIPVRGDLILPCHNSKEVALIAFQYADAFIEINNKLEAKTKEQ